MGSRNYSRDTGPDWTSPIAMVVLAITIVLAGAPAMLLGVILYRLTAQYAWSRVLWFVLFLIGGAALYYLYEHGLEYLLIREFTDFIHIAEKYQTDFGHWPVRQLWSDIWPVWIRTVTAAPLVTVCFALFDKPGGINQHLHQRQRQQARQVSKARRRALKQATNTKIPDTINGHMVIGLLIDDDMHEEDL